MSGVPFTRLTAIGVPLLRNNIDTDAIIPSREIKSVSKSGLADGLFAGWRYLGNDSREPDPAFILNRPGFVSGKILVAGENFGCGSSREHAAWALAEYGFRAIVAPSFNPIFRGNAIRNGIVPVELEPEQVQALASHLLQNGGSAMIDVDLDRSLIGWADNQHAFALEQESREMLLLGLDAIALTLRDNHRIVAFRERDQVTRPWAYLRP